MDFLRYDSPFMTECRKAVDFVLLGLLWILASIPLFTFGAATTAMYYTAEKNVRTDAGKIWVTFWSRFKKEFKQATIVWLFGLVVTVIMTVNSLLLIKGDVHSVIFALLLAATLFGIGWMQLWYGYLSRFEDTTWVLLSNTFRIALSNFPKLVVMILIFVASVLAAVISFYYAGPVLFLIPGIYVGLTGIVLRKIFKPYMPEEPKPEGEEDEVLSSDT